ncbi:10647_t:CDS:2 [Entrophospora sp. SA101]|nr:10647_t:CDS:2 [Entrophospora sp. SA101]
MGVGWIQTNQKNEPLTFSASVENWPSSTKTEVLAILSVPPVTPLRIGVLIDDLVIPFTADRFLYIATVGVTPELMFLKVLQMILILKNFLQCSFVL